MATGERLFDPQPGKYFSRDDGRTPLVLFISLPEASQSLNLDVSLCLDHVARIIELLGRIPPQIAFSRNKSTKFFSRPGKNWSKEVYSKKHCGSLTHSYSAHTVFIPKVMLRNAGYKQGLNTSGDIIKSSNTPCPPLQSRSVPEMNAKS